MWSICDFSREHILVAGEINALCPELSVCLRENRATVSFLPEFTERQDWHGQLRAIVAEHGKMDGLVILQPRLERNPLHTFDMCLERQNWKRGYWGIVHVLQQCLRAKYAKPSCSTVLLAAGLVAETLMRSAAAEYAPKGYRVNMVEGEGKAAVPYITFLLSHASGWVSGRNFNVGS